MCQWMLSRATNLQKNSHTSVRYNELGAFMGVLWQLLLGNPALIAQDSLLQWCSRGKSGMLNVLRVWLLKINSCIFLMQSPSSISAVVAEVQGSMSGFQEVPSKWFFIIIPSMNDTITECYSFQYYCLCTEYTTPRTGKVIKYCWNVRRSWYIIGLSVKSFYSQRSKMNLFPLLLGKPLESHSLWLPVDKLTRLVVIIIISEDRSEVMLSEFSMKALEG